MSVADQKENWSKGLRTKRWVLSLLLYAWRLPSTIKHSLLIRNFWNDNFSHNHILSLAICLVQIVEFIWFLFSIHLMNLQRLLFTFQYSTDFFHCLYSLSFIILWQSLPCSVDFFLFLNSSNKFAMMNVYFCNI